MGGPEISLYVHVPFCLARCSYCDFYSVTDLSPAASVVDRILARGSEDLERLGRPRLRTVYVGGGTPSALGRRDLAKLLEAIALWGGDRAAEVTVEANPETLDREFLGICASTGVTRLSVGVQALEPDLLRLLGRRATREVTLAALERARSHWRGALSVDLLAGIPGQTIEALRANIDEVLVYGPDHVSLYSLTREKGTPYDASILAGRISEMPAEEQERLWLAGVGLLRRRGYRHYEISNFALPGSECLHNSGTWALDPYLGVGPAAVSTLPGGATGVLRLSEPRSVHAWLAGSAPGLEQVSARDFFFEHLMMGLRMARGIPIAALGSRFGRAAAEWALDAWQRHGSRGTRVRAGRITLTRKGWLLLSGLLAELLEEIEGLAFDAVDWPDGGSRGLQPM